MVVVVAGNPYTETGQKCKLPDMLTNRADTYNLGDILGGREESFKASYLENAITSNPVLAPLANRSQKDIRTFIRMGEPNASQEPLEGSYTPQEIEEILAVMRHLLRIREVVLKVNQEYIRSAAQADEFRTEPPFRLQGSYRNMNRMAEKIAAVMNGEEVGGLILDHYRSESQTLATGAEANLLKLKELLGLMDANETTRWAEIKRTFQRNQVSRGADGTDPVGRLVAQLSAFQHGLESIQQTLHQGLTNSQSPEVSLTEKVDRLHAELTVLHSTLASLRTPDLKWNQPEPTSTLSR